MTNQLSFNDKKKMLFDSLTTAEQCIKGTRLEQREETYLNQTRQNQSKEEVSRRFRGKESIFKRPEAPINKCLRPRRVPDHQVFYIIIIKNTFNLKFSPKIMSNYYFFFVYR